MDYNEIYGIFNELKEILLEKKQAIINKDLEKLSLSDEASIVVLEKIKKIDILNNNFDEEEKENLKNLGKEIKNIQENNEILIKHSLGVINNILSGILNIVQNDKSSYNAKGSINQSSESLDISSITEEA